jgi:BASS family bile acid:Na+ symporter
MNDFIALDEVRLNFSPESLTLLNIVLGFVMFGIALSLKVDSFKQVMLYPKSVILGVISQFFILPFITFLLVSVLQPHPSMALGMLLVAACPGGNISNFISVLAQANTELSVSLTAIATVVAVFMTPFNISFWASLSPLTAPLVQSVSLDAFSMFKTVFLLLGFPLLLGMFFAHRFPSITQKIIEPIKKLSLLFFISFIVIAFYGNFDYFVQYIHLVVGLVFIHNLVALLAGYGWAKLGGLDNKDARTLSIETGIQNAGLGLILVFSFFDGLGGMAIIAAWWGIWDIIAGLSIATWWQTNTIN